MRHVYFDCQTIAPESEYSPDKALLAAVLQRAITDVFDVRDGYHGTAGLKERKQALDWFAAGYSNDPEPMSFQWICDLLELEPEPIRKAVMIGDAFHFSRQMPRSQKIKRYRRVEK